MNYLSKNLKTLREHNNFTQTQFGKLFGLSRGKISSYEDGSDMGTQKYLEVCDYFDLNPQKFLKLNMKVHDVSSTSDNDKALDDALLASESIDTPEVSDDDRFGYIQDFSHSKLIKFCKTLLKNKEGMAKEIIQLQSSKIKIQQELIDKFKSAEEEPLD